MRYDTRILVFCYISLHWLRVPERIQFKIAVLTYRVLHGDAPRYLGPFTSILLMSLVDGHCVLL